MRLLKSLPVIMLSSIVAFSLPAVAETSKPAAKKSQQQSDKELKRFASSITLSFNGIELDTSSSQPTVHFKYTLKNISKKEIKKVEWIATYLHNNRAILIQDEPVTLNKFTPKSSRNLTFSLPFNALPLEAQKVFSDPNNKISIQFQAKSITFTDKSQIIVK